MGGVQGPGETITLQEECSVRVMATLFFYQCRISLRLPSLISGDSFSGKVGGFFETWQPCMGLYFPVNAVFDFG